MTVMTKAAKPAKVADWGAEPGTAEEDDEVSGQGERRVRRRLNTSKTGKTGTGKTGKSGKGDKKERKEKHKKEKDERRSKLGGKGKEMVANAGDRDLEMDFPTLTLIDGALSECQIDFDTTGALNDVRFTFPHFVTSMVYDPVSAAVEVGLSDPDNDTLEVEVDNSTGSVAARESAAESADEGAGGGTSEATGDGTGGGGSEGAALMDGAGARAPLALLSAILAAAAPLWP